MPCGTASRLQHRTGAYGRANGTRRAVAPPCFASGSRSNADGADTFREPRPIGYDGWLTVEAFSRCSPDFASKTRVWRSLRTVPRRSIAKPMTSCGRIGGRPARISRGPIASADFAPDKAAGWPADPKNWTHVQQSLAGSPAGCTWGQSHHRCRVVQREQRSDPMISIARHDARHGGKHGAGSRLLFLLGACFLGDLFRRCSLLRLFRLLRHVVLSIWVT
jgi:hypothetical protein